jgi:sugar/nucleoside kinase (ribokinase family)
VVVGDVCVDVVARVGGPLATGSDTAAEIRTTGGGGGGNVAAWLASLGVPVTLVARIGDDTAGRAQAAELSGYGVRCAFTVDPGADTGAIVVLVGPDGERTMLADRGANLRLCPADLPAPLPLAGHLHLSGYTLLHGHRPTSDPHTGDPHTGDPHTGDPNTGAPREAGLVALRRARDAGLTISVDPASVAPLAEVGPAAFLAWTGGVDLLLPNLAEAQLLSGRTGPVAAARVLTSHYRAVAVTIGADGALWASGDAVAHVPAEPVTPVDTTGAGDAFAAGLLAAWLTGADGPAAVRRGVAVAADAVTRIGGRPPAAAGRGGGPGARPTGRPRRDGS